MPATGAIIQSVSQTKGAIGYVGMAYANKEVKEIHVSYDGGKTYVQPTKKNAKAGKYPIVRPLYFFYEAKSEKAVRPFINYILSAPGQTIVEEVGYLAIK